MIYKGLQLLSKDKRDLNAGALFQLPALSELPEEYYIEPLSIKDQNADGNLDFCAGCAGAGMIEPKEEAILYYPYLWAAAKYESGQDIGSFGVDIRSVGKALTKWGVPELKDVPESVLALNADERRDFKNYPQSVRDSAAKHKQQTYMFINGKDAYDETKRQIWKFRDSRQQIIFGMDWAWDVKDFILDGTSVSGFGHSMWVSGWFLGGLRVVNSVGKTAGRMGTHSMSRETYNFAVSRYGALMIVDKPREEIEYYIQNSIKEGDNWLIQIMKAIWTLIASPFVTQKEKVDIIKKASNTLNILAQKVSPEPQNAPVKPVVVPEPVVPPKYLWSTPKEARHSSRVIMDEYNLSWANKDLLCAVISAESGFDNNAVCKNKNAQGVVTSIDVGICQINSYWHTGVGKTFPSTDYVVAHPEEAVAFMVKMFKAGKLHLWVGYTSGNYLKFL